MEKMQVVSTRWTLFLKIVLPTVWVCFFAGLSVVLLWADIKVADNAPFSPTTAKLLIISFSISSIGLLYLLFMRIKWVALSKEGFMVSNFFKSYKYSFDSLAAVEETKVLWWKRIGLQLRAKGAFGDKLFFIAGYQWEAYLEKNADIMQAIVAATAEAKS